MKYFALISALLLFTATLQSQESKEEFTIIKEIPHTPGSDQGSTGTCWSFATTSFLESEIMRKGLPETKLSEMFFVYYAYLNKAEQYLFYQGNNNFGQGGQAHDVIDVLRENGLSTFDEFPGVKVNGKYNHRELAAELELEVMSLNKKKEGFNASDPATLEPILKTHLGKLSKKIKTKNGTFSPDDLREQFKLNPDDYVELTSYNHHPFYSAFVLEVPDNWAHGLYYNLPIGELVSVMYYALENGYTVCWDGDDTEKTFQHRKGKADLPVNDPGKIDQEMRQKTFYDRTTTDDHLMHLVGLSTDSSGKSCFYTKNSWGAESNDYGGYLHLTEDYVRLKTIAIMLHKDAIPENIRTKLKL